MEHTPVPWELSGNTIYDQEGKGVAQSAWEIMAEFNIGDHAIFLKRSEKDEEVARANAEFILRACNSHDALLKAAKEAYSRIDGPIVDALKGGWHGATGLHNTLGQLRDAIDKAEKEI